MFEYPTEFEAQLRRALDLELPYFERLLRPGSSHASVLALIARSEFALPDNPTGLSLLVIRRADLGEELKAHSGQMAFPGGRSDFGEISRQDFMKTALRETQEEVGISSSLIRVVGALPEITAVSDYRVLPYVGILQVPLEGLKMQINPAEVAEALWVPWAELICPASYTNEMIRRDTMQFSTHVYQVQGRRIWGLTGAIIKNLLDRLERIG